MSVDPPATNPFLPGAPKALPEGPDALISWSARSQSGSRKPVNDDSFLLFASGGDGATSLPDEGRKSLKNHDLVFAVSDGMGGGQAGDLASKLVLESLSRIIPETFKSAASGIYPDYLSHLAQSLQDIHEKINEAGAAAQDTKGMAATLALAWFTPETLYFLNVGDSRIYLHRDGETTQLSQDHTLAWGKLRRGEITERQFRNHPRRAALYQIVGGGHRSVKPHISSIPWKFGDRLLICSDGLIDGLWDKHIHAKMGEKLFSTSESSEALMCRAFSNAGEDDTTLIVLSLDQA